MDIDTNTHKKTKMIILCIIVAFLVVIMGGLVGYWIGNNVRTTTNQTSTTVPSSKTKTTSPSTTQQQVATPAVTNCSADKLALSVAPSENGAAGTIVYTLNLTNISKVTCTLYGFPGVSLTNDAGTQIGSPATHVTNYTETTLTLAANVSVKFDIYTTDSGAYTNGQCSTGVTKFRVYPPGAIGYLMAASPVTSWCPGFETSPVLAM